MVLSHKKHQDGAGLRAPKRFILPEPAGRGHDRVNLLQFSNRFAAQPSQPTIIASLKTNLRWIWRTYARGGRTRNSLASCAEAKQIAPPAPAAGRISLPDGEGVLTTSTPGSKT